MEVDVDTQNVRFASPRKKRKIEVVLRDETDLDKLLISTMAAGKDEAKKLLDLYGAVRNVSPVPLKVTIHGSCINAGKITASSGATAYWGPNARRNKSARAWGAQTSPRAKLLSLILALENAPTYKSIDIFTRSEYVVRSVTYYAATNAACGWRCANGDLLKRILVLIKRRTAPLQFRHLK
ncbi:hypothetical protein FB451DRAFT_1035699, partial [Mycena latifolia]